MNAGPSGEWYTEVLPDGRVAMFRGPRPASPPGKFSRAAQARWDAAHLVTLSTRVNVEDARKFVKACQAQDRTPYAVLKDFVLRTANPPLDGGS